MSDVINEPHPPKRNGYRPDFQLADTVVEVKSDLHSFRNLRAALLQLAYYLADADEKGLIVLVNPRITEAALQKEWEMVKQTLHPNIVNRLSLSVRRGSGLHEIAGTVEPSLANKLVQYVDQQAREQPYRAPRSSHAILLVLLNEWFTRKGPMTTQWLMHAVGCSYPTAARAVRRLDPVIKRFSDRRIQLWGFPSEEWQRALTNRDVSHPTLHYADRSGQPRNIASLLRRASKLDREDIAVGGVVAAQHYYPEFDLRGTPRLDLTLHSPDGRADLSFIQRLDPALERIPSRVDRASLAVHVLRRQAALFEPNEDGLPWADRVTTLLDLFDARLDPQANEFLEQLIASVG